MHPLRPQKGEKKSVESLKRHSFSHIHAFYHLYTSGERKRRKRNQGGDEKERGTEPGSKALPLALHSKEKKKEKKRERTGGVSFTRHQKGENGPRLFIWF